MSVTIEDALRGGFDRLVARNGLLLVAVFAIVGFVASLLSIDVSLGIAQQYLSSTQLQGQAGPRLGLPLAAAGGGMVLLMIGQLVVTVGAIRTFVSDERDRLVRDRFTRNIGWVVVNLVVGGIVFGIVVGLGLVALVIPGLFLLVSLFFWNFHVAIEDDNFIEGFKQSWSLTKGNRLMLFALGVIVVVLSMVVSFVGNIVSFVAPQIVALAVSSIVSGVIAVYSLATGADAYLQLDSAIE